jgi:uncharacterized delta-60 repeat protein
MAMLNGAGSVDPAFAVISYNVTSIRAIAVQPDGKIIAGGAFNRLNGASRTALVRFNTNGTPDLTFDSGQLVAVNVFKILFQTDGKILIVGSGLSVNGGSAKTMVRLNSDGTVDGSFNLATISQIALGTAAAVQPDGKIIFSYTTTSTSPIGGFGTVRLNSDGSLDGTWTNNFPNSRFESLAVLPNGQVLAAGPFGITYVNSLGGTSESHNGILRINSDGSHDRTFRSALITDDTSFTAVYTMQVLGDGRIFVGGRLYTGGSPGPFGILRLNATGTLDGSFQANAISSYLGLAHVFSIAQLANGKLLVGGFFDLYGGTGHLNLARLESNGAVDQTFTSGTDYTVSAIATEASGSILIGGSFEKVNGVPRTSIARLLAGPIRRAPFDFDGDGKTDIGITRPLSIMEWWINRSGDGQTTALQFGSSTDKVAPADYTGDGKTDITFWRPSSGEWYVLRSEDNSFFSFPFGTNGDIPAPADFDADGKGDFAVFRPSSATWFIRRSTDGQVTFVGFGANGDIPIASDYDCDGRADVAIYRNNNGVAEWWINP